MGRVSNPMFANQFHSRQQFIIVGIVSRLDLLRTSKILCHSRFQIRIADLHPRQRILNATKKAPSAKLMHEASDKNKKLLLIGFLYHLMFTESRRKLEA